MSCAGCFEKKPLVDYRPCGHFYCAECTVEIPDERDRGCQIPLNISLEQAYEMVAVYDNMAIKEETYWSTRINQWYKNCVDNNDCYHHESDARLAGFRAGRKKQIATLTKRLTELSLATKRAEAVIQAREALNDHNEHCADKISLAAFSGEPIKVYFASRLVKSPKHLNLDQEKESFSRRFKDGEIELFRPGMTIRDGHKAVPFVAWMFNQDRIPLGTVQVPNVSKRREKFKLLGTRGDLIFLDVELAGIWELDLKNPKPRRCEEYPAFDPVPKIKVLDSATVLLPDNILVVLDIPEMRLAAADICPYAPGGVYQLIVNVPFRKGGSFSFSSCLSTVNSLLEIPRN